MGDRTSLPEQSEPKSGGAAVPISVGELVPNLTQCRVGRGLPQSVACAILIHLTVWPQYTNVTDRQTGQTR